VKNIRLLISYDGTAFQGWQKSSAGPSIEESLQTPLEMIFQQKIILQAASRTDAGVHAHGQVVNFICDRDILDLGQLQYSLNKLLCSDIAVLEAVEAPIAFHPTLDCKEKEYHYYISFGLAPSPEHRLYSWHCHPLNHLTDMRKAAVHFVGNHDFSAFCNHRFHMQYEDYIREVYALDIEEIEGERLLIKVRGKNFLYRMVRNIVGTLAYVGMGKIPLAEVASIIVSGDRKRAGITAPAQGLFLHHVFY
jgi:tRNA pseudouridine38-40 synthase